MTTGAPGLDLQHRRHEFVAELIRSGAIRSPAWRLAFEQVPRDVFVPRFYRALGGTAGYALVDGTDPAQRDAWAAAVYTDDALVTQLHGDHDTPSREPAGEAAVVTGRSSSSSTQPSLMAIMLEALEINDGDRVLEIGTGTGYNTALLSERLGSDRVVSIDVDASLAAQARARLADCGYTPTVVAGDGALGYPHGAPYDRLIATCSTDRIPPAWIQQVRPGGLILTALYRGLGGFGMLRLEVQGDGSASGLFLNEPGAFMPLRTVGTLKPPDPLSLLHAIHDPDPPSRPALVGHDVLRSHDAGLWLALRLPCQVTQIGVRSQDDTWQRYLLGTDGSWARLTETADGEHVQEGGPRRLWSELEHAYQAWLALGSPPRDRLGLTVDATDHHTIWLDTPASEHRWALPTT